MDKGQKEYLNGFNGDDRRLGLFFLTNYLVFLTHRPLYACAVPGRSGPAHPGNFVRNFWPSSAPTQNAILFIWSGFSRPDLMIFLGPLWSLVQSSSYTFEQGKIDKCLNKMYATMAGACQPTVNHQVECGVECGVWGGGWSLGGEWSVESGVWSVECGVIS